MTRHEFMQKWAHDCGLTLAQAELDYYAVKCTCGWLGPNDNGNGCDGWKMAVKPEMSKCPSASWILSARTS